MTPEEGFWRFAHGEFDVAEYSFSTFLAMRSRGDMPFVGLPVFPSRMFRHGAIYVRRDAGIESPGDLVGRRVGVPEYAMTAALIARAVLHHDYGVAPRAIRWVQGGLEQPGRREKLRLEIPPDIELTSLEPTETLQDALAAGQLDGIISARPPTMLRRDPARLRRLFEDCRALELDWYRRTAIWPIMHLVCIRRELYERHPWVAVSMVRGFTEAKDWALEQLRESAANAYALAWQGAYAEEERAVLGADPWPYGVEPNRSTLTAMARFSHEQGLATRVLTPEEMFPESTLDLAKV